MLTKSGWFLFLLTVLQVSARYKRVETDFIDYEISQEPVAVSPSSSRIIAGWVAEPGQHPHHAALRMVGSNGGIGLCGGSVVSEEWVLTCAFCTNNRILAVVRAGVVHLTNPEYIFETTEWYFHPKYNISSLNLQAYDISLIKLQRPVVYTEFVKPIQIQSRADAFRNYDGQQVYASGHGRTSATGPESDVLRWVYLQAISNTACRWRYPTAVFDTTICAQFFNVTTQNTCLGDTGGPLVHVGSDGVPTLIGVSFFFPSGCRSGLPTGYTRPGPFLSWLEEVMGMNISTNPTSPSTPKTTTTPRSTDTTSSTTTSPISTTTETRTSTNATLPSTSTTTTNLGSTGSTSLTTTSPMSTITTTPTSTIPGSPSAPTTTTTLKSTDTTSSTTTSPTSTNATLSSTPTTTTTPTSTETTSSTTINSTSNAPISTTPDATSPTSTDSEDFPPEETTTERPEDDNEKDDSDSSESDDDDDMAQLLKRLLVDVKVKVRLNKYNVTKVRTK